jgi:hypothetical protein
VSLVVSSVGREERGKGGKVSRMAGKIDGDSILIPM